MRPEHLAPLLAPLFVGLVVFAFVMVRKWWRNRNG